MKEEIIGGNILALAGLPIGNKYKSNFTPVEDDSSFTKITRIPTPCGSPIEFSPLNLISPNNTGLEIFGNNKKKSFRKEGAKIKVGCSGVEQNDSPDKPNESAKKRLRSWRIYKWLKRNKKPEIKQEGEDEEFEVTTGLRRVYDDEKTPSTFSETSTLQEEDCLTARQQDQRVSAGYSFINFNKMDHFESLSSTSALENTQNFDESSKFSFEPTLEQDNFHSVSCVSPRNGFLAKISSIRRSRESFRRKWNNKKQVSGEVEASDTKTMNEISLQSEQQDLSPTTIPSLRYKISLKLFPGYNFNGSQTSVLSGYLSESPHKDLTDRYLCDQDGDKNLDEDLERLCKDPNLDIFCQSNLQRANKRIKKKKSLRNLFSAAGEVEEDKNWNPYERQSGKDYAAYSDVETGHLRTQEEEEEEMAVTHMILEDYYMSSKVPTALSRSSSNYHQSNQQRQLQNQSLNELIKKRTASNKT